MPAPAGPSAVPWRGQLQFTSVIPAGQSLPISHSIPGSAGNHSILLEASLKEPLEIQRSHTPTGILFCFVFTGHWSPAFSHFSLVSASHPLSINYTSPSAEKLLLPEPRSMRLHRGRYACREDGMHATQLLPKIKQIADGISETGRWSVKGQREAGRDQEACFQPRTGLWLPRETL